MNENSRSIMVATILFMTMVFNSDSSPELFLYILAIFSFPSR